MVIFMSNGHEVGFAISTNAAEIGLISNQQARSEGLTHQYSLSGPLQLGEN